MKDTGRPFTLSWVAALIGTGLVCIGVFLASAANSTTMVAAYYAGIMTVVMALLGMGRIRLERRRVIEAEQLEHYRRTHGSSDLFEDADEAVRLADRAAEQYTKYFIPAINILIGGILIAMGISTWHGWGQLPFFPMADRPLAMAAISTAVFIGALIAGSYYVGVSREKGCRWLRATGSWMFFTGAIFFGNAIVMGCEHAQRWPETIDIRVAKIAMALLIILGAELMASVVIEFYRPRVPGEQERPIIESRLLALFTEPGGVARNFATTLDYQFGFSVSEARFYRFLERILVPAVVLLALLLWLQTCLVVIATEENGLREHFGHVDPEPLQPGLYIKFPSPFEKIYRYPVHEIQEIALGYADDATEPEDDGHGHEAENNDDDSEHRIIVWSQSHRQEETKYIVASRAASTPQQETGADAPVAAYSLAATVPIYFRVKDLYDFKYRHQDGQETLTRLAAREVFHYLSTVDFFAILTSGREEGTAYLAQRIQTEADKLQLGIQIVSVGLQGLHPPVEVGASFDDVVAATEERETRILQAETYHTETVVGSRGEEAVLLNEAEAYRLDKVQNSAATAARFANQLLGYRQSPQLFVLNSLLDVLENEGAETRKYIVAAESGRRVFTLDLIEKGTSGLLSGDIPQKAENADQ